MSQLSPPAAPVRSAGAADAPEVLFVLRRYIWLVVIGTALATGIGYGLYLYFHREMPQYTAKGTFQVLPAAPTYGTARGGGEGPVTQDEIGSFIRRQMYVIQGDGVRERALQSDEFQHDYHDRTTSKHSRWLMENPIFKAGFKRDLSVTPIANSN